MARPAPELCVRRPRYLTAARRFCHLFRLSCTVINRSLYVPCTLSRAVVWSADRWCPAIERHRIDLQSRNLSDRRTAGPSLPRSPIRGAILGAGPESSDITIEVPRKVAQIPLSAANNGGQIVDGRKHRVCVLCQAAAGRQSWHSEVSM